MSRYFKTLWKEAGPGGPCPRISPADIQRRVDAALEQAPIERNRFMRQKLRLGAALCALLLVLVGAALAISRNLDLLRLFFDGDPSVVEPYVQNPDLSTTDGRFAFTIHSSVTDGQRALLLVTVEALTEEAAEVLFSDDFSGMDTWHVLYGEGYAVPNGLGWGEEKNLRTETSCTFSLSVDLGSPGKLGIWLDVMSEDHALVVPEGADMGGTHLTPGEEVATPDGATYTVNSVTLTPISLQMDAAWTGQEGLPTPNILFRMTDGSVLPQNAVLSLHQQTQDAGVRSSYTDYNMHTVLDVSQVSALIIEDREFPLDGSPSIPADVDPYLYLSYIPVGEKYREDLGFTVPVSALCDTLGADYVWDKATGTLTATYRDVTLVFTENSDRLLVNGQEQTLDSPSQRKNGELYAAYDSFTQWSFLLSWTGAVGKNPNLFLVIP